MRAFNKHMLAMVFGLLPMMAMAHPGHDQTHVGFWEGLIHPFTGLDHLVMAIGFGVLLWTVAKQWRVLGILGLSLSLVIGFILGANQIVPANIAEYGIVNMALLLL